MSDSLSFSLSCSCAGEDPFFIVIDFVLMGAVRLPFKIATDTSTSSDVEAIVSIGTFVQISVSDIKFVKSKLFRSKRLSVLKVYIKLYDRLHGRRRLPIKCNVTYPDVSYEQCTESSVAI